MARVRNSMKKCINSRIRKIETSKKLLLFSVAMVVIVTIATIFAVFILEDTSPLEFLISGIFALTSTAFGFYYWKAKNENCAKYGNHIDDDV